MNNYSRPVILPHNNAFPRNVVVTKWLGKYFRVAGLLLLLLAICNNKVSAFTTSYAPASATASSNAFYCIGNTPIDLNGSIVDGGTLELGASTNANVQWYWYYNTTGATGTLAGATLVYTGTPYTSSGTTTTANLPGADISTSASGIYYYFIYVNYSGGTTGPGEVYSNLVTIVVNNSSPPINGPGSVCEGVSITLTDATVGGVWTSSNTGVATVGSSTGVVTGGGTSGTSTITYVSAGCDATTVVSVNPISPISGVVNICQGSSSTLSDAAAGAGTWISSNTIVATIGSVSGIVSGASAGTSTISYTSSLGCSAGIVVTVNGLPTGVTAGATPNPICNGGTLTLNGGATGATSYSWTEPGGTAITSPTTINASVGGVIAGNAGVYTLSATNSCGTTKGVTSAVTINTVPSGVTASATPNPVCNGGTLTLNGGATGATSYSWAEPGGTAITSPTTISASVGGVIAGNAGVYTLSATNSCGTTKGVTSAVTINTVPTGVTASATPNPVCNGGTLTLNGGATGATTYSWTEPGGTAITSPTTINASVGGVVAGNAGVYTLSATNSCGTTNGVTSVVTVNTAPTGVTASATPNPVCNGGTLTLNGGATGATSYLWTEPGGTAITSPTTINASVGGVIAGNAGVYTLSATNACGTTTGVTSIVTVNAAIIAGTITGLNTVCTGSTITLSDATASGGTGTWSSSNPGVGSVDPTLGIVGGQSGGTTMITYTETSASCGSATTTMIVTVNVSPNAGLITGSNTLCTGLTTTLADLTASGGTGAWSSSNTAVGTVGSTTGTVYGVSSGTTTISYTETSLYCGTATTTTNMTVNTSPIAGTITGLNTVCTGSTITLSDATASGGTGTWSSSNPGVGSVDPTLGIVGGQSGGTTMITYTETSASCGSATTTMIVTVNVSPNAGLITGSNTLCTGLTTTLADLTASGGTGTWSSSNTAVGTIGSTTGTVYGVSSGTTTISYTETSLYCGSATTTTNMTVNTSPVAGTITGLNTVCTGQTITLSDGTASGATGTWSSSNPGVGTVDATTGIVYGESGGTTMITYTETSASCGSVYTTMTVTVNVSPNAGLITGSNTLCTGLTTTLADLTTSGGTGTWSSNNTTVGTVGSTTGTVYGVGPGTTIISYTETSLYCGSATATTNITVYSSPVAGTITGLNTVCTGSTITLSDGTASGATGTWSSSNPGVGSVDPTLGIVAGLSGGTTMITYTETSASCGSATTTMVVTVNISPNAGAITGSNTLCTGLTTTLADLTASGGTGMWSSSNTAVGTIGSTTGTVYGVSPGTTIISYTETSLYCGSATTTANMTVNISPVAGTINGLNTVCTGLTITLSDGTASGGTGTWSSSTPGTGTVGATTGIVYGVSGGTTMITYTETSASCGAVYTTQTVTVNVSPNAGAITGATGVCVGSTITLNDGTSSGGTGAWSSSNTAAGTIGSTTGIVYGVSPGTTIISYTETSLYCGSATATTNITVNVSPVAGTITGLNTVCTGLTITLSDATASGGTGTWSSSTPGTGTVGATTGIVYGVSSGTTMITYTETSASCGAATTTMIVSVNVSPNAGAITGAAPVCVGTTLSLADGTASGGTGAWSSSNTAAGTIGSTTGTVYGVSPGTTIISYTETSLYCGSATATTNITVNISPVAGAITGLNNVCVGLTITLSDATASGGTGTWSSSNMPVGTIGSTTGTVYGVSNGTTMITYTETSASCGSSYTTTVITVNANPATITGTMSVCVGLTTALSSSPLGGTWNSSNGNAGINGSTGVVTGDAAGTSVITYELATGCLTSTVVTVNANPATITGSLNVCSGLTTTLTSLPLGGTWSSSNGAIAATSGTSGTVTGASVAVSSTATITYTLPTGCITTAIVTVNPLPVAISGTLSVCAGLTTPLTDASTPGTWSSSATGVAQVGVTSGVVTGVSAGTSTIIYVLGTGCQTTAIVTVNPLPGSILGVSSVCQGATTSLSDVTASGIWNSSNTSVATVSGGLVTGTATGSSALTATISYTLPTGCIETDIVTVNPLPTSILGTLAVCSGLSTTLTDATAGGSWSSSSTTTASIILTTGVLTGGTAGTAMITYKLIATGCTTETTVTVDPLPASILGTLKVCSGLTTILSDVTGGGTWSSSSTSVATISSTGVVTGGAVAVTSESVITYTLPTGCIATAVVTVNPLPGTINGIKSVCLGLQTYLSDATSAGAWSSSNSNALISVTGTVTGNNVGTSTITYTLVTGCIETAGVTVNALPGAINGILNVCVYQTTQLSDASSGGMWSSSNTAIGTAGSVSGGIYGVSAGTITVTYMLPTGCISTAVVTVNPQPRAIEGISVICYESSTLLSDSTAGGVWSSGNSSVAAVGTGGEVTTNGSGTATISYTLSAGCTSTDIVTVNPLPAVYTVTPTGGTYCQGGAGEPIGLNGSSVGVSYLLYYDSSVAGYLAGTGLALNFGSLTVAGTYTVRATNSTTGCISAMLGSAQIIVTPTVNPVVSIISTHGDTVCPGTSVLFYPDTLHGGASPSYKWFVNGVLVSIDTTYTYIPANGDIVSVQMTSDGICVFPSTASASLAMVVLPDAAAGVSISIYPGDTVCQYAVATFTATPSFGGPAPQYMWYVNGVQQAGGGQEFSYHPSTGDIVYCKLVSDYRCRISDTGYSNAAIMTVSPMIVPHIEIMANPGFIVTAGQTDSLWAVVTDAGSSPTYQWDVNGVPVNGATQNYYVSQFNNYDSVECTVTSSGACDGISSFDWIYITVNSTGVQQYATGSGDIRLMPNPNSGVFTLKGTLGTALPEEVTIEVTDMLGQVVYSHKVQTSGGSINEQVQLDGNLANGMYLLNLQSGSDNKVFHFVIEK